jgi:signal transduction histidine kinase/HPt (histidine-containing phosphotransfer) domain-containing protein/ActR/RegA family two-component response regulator
LIAKRPARVNGADLPDDPTPADAPRNASGAAPSPVPVWRERDALLAGLALLAVLFAGQLLLHELIPLRPSMSVHLVPVLLAAALGGQRAGLVITASALLVSGVLEIVNHQPVPPGGLPTGFRLLALGLIGALASMIGGFVHARHDAQRRDWAARMAAERGLRQTEARDSFLLALHDTLRRPDAAGRTLTEALRLLADAVDAAGAAFAARDEVGGHVAIHPDDMVGAPELVGRHVDGDFGIERLGRLAKGRTLVVDDTARSADLDAPEKAAWAAARIGSAVIVPDFDEEHLTSALLLFRRQAGPWPAEDVRLIEEAAVRIAAAAQSTRAQALAVERTRLLEESRNRMAHAEQAARVSAWAMNLHTGAIVWPECSLPLLGLSAHEELHSWAGWRQLLDPVDVARLTAQFREAVRRREMLDARFRMRLPDGSVRWLLLRADVVNDDRGRPAQLTGLVMDVTDQERLRAASASKSAFLANMSHEIRTPLSVIVGLTDRLRRSAHDERESRLLDQLRDTGEHLMQVINDILDLSKIEAGQLLLNNAPFSLGEVLDRTLRLFEDQAAGKGLALTLDAAAETCTLKLRGDALRLSQVLINLCSNAIKFTSTGGVVIGALAMPVEDGRAGLRLWVADTGSGIEPHLRDQLFDPFFQADSSPSRRTGGTGLGLAICKRLVDQMHGRITVESQPGRGSRFQIELELPLESAGHEASDTMAPEPAHVRTTSLTGRRILVVEDHPLTQEILTEMLEDLGCDVILASDGLEAVDLAAAGRYDLILMDLQLPTLDGMGATRLIRLLPLHQHTPIVALSANAFLEDRVLALEAGMNEHLGKPVTLEVLAEALARWTGPQEPVPPAENPPDPALLAAVSRLPGVAPPASWRGSQRSLWDFGQILQHLVDSVIEDAARIRVHLDAGDRQPAYELAHRAAGAASMVGAEGIAEALMTLERNLRAPDNPAADSGLLDAVEQRVRNLGAALRSLREAKTPGT